MPFFHFFTKLLKNLKCWGRKTKHPIFEKLRFLAIWTTLSDRARRDISIASILASRGPLQPIFEALLHFDCFVVPGFTFLASYHITTRWLEDLQGPRCWAD